MKAYIIIFYIVIILFSCKKNNPNSASISNDSIVKDTSNIFSKSEDIQEIVYSTEPNYINIDSIRKYFLIEEYWEEFSLENLRSFFNIKYNNNYKRIEFINPLILNNDTIFQYHNTPLVIGKIYIDENTNYLILNQNGDYYESIILLLIKGDKICDFINILGHGGDGGDFYFQNIVQMNDSTYKSYYGNFHNPASEPDTLTYKIVESQITFYKDSIQEKKLKTTSNKSIFKNHELSYQFAKDKVRL